MLPTHGAASGVFLLANAAKFRNCRDLHAWIGVARGRSSFMAGAVDLEGCAQGMLRLGLATIPAASVRLEQRLIALADQADRRTLIAISSLLLRADPPPWISLAVRDGVVFREYIPSDDLRDLEWLEPHLDQLLGAAADGLTKRYLEPLREGLGMAGELVILAAAAEACMDALHVADISDAYGYDVEIHTSSTRRIEVKSATNGTQGTFHLSRNEFNKSIQYGCEWLLIQVTFDSSIFTDQFVSASHVLSIMELTGQKLQDLVPPDSAAFRWSESAIVYPAPSSWVPSDLKVPATFRLPSIRELSKCRGSQFTRN